MRRTLLLTALLPLATLLLPPGPSGGPVHAADKFTYTMRREVHAVDVKSGAEVPFVSEKVGAENRRTLGVTGRVAIARRTILVEDGGQVFVHASVPEALAGKAHDLDVLIDGKDGMRVRGSIRFEPGSSRRVARLFVLPELQPGPALVEVHVRGVHIADWQEIVTEEVDVPKKGKLRFGYSLEGTSAGSPSVELVVEAREAGNADAKPLTLLSRRASGSNDAWEEEVSDLGKLAGKKVRFAFRSRPSDSKAASAPGVVWGAPAVEVEEKRRAYPIIVLISLDSLRVSSVGLYSKGSATPFLDSFFGRKGAVMTQAATQSVTTLPSHLTLMTGLNPLSHGVTDETRSLGSGVTTLAESLRRRGWHTAAFTEGGALAGELGFRRGFDIYDEGETLEIDPFHSDALERAKKWLDEYSGAPLFLFVHTYATRPVHGGVNATLDSAVREQQLGAYVEQVRAADLGVRGLFETMRGRIDEDKALYIVTTGHGEEFFEHGAVGHGTQLYDETVRVPLLIRGERVRKTGRQDLSVGLVDVAPTILELSDTKVPSGMQGRSFARLLAKGTSVLAAPRFTEARRPVRLTSAGKLMLWGPPAYSVRDGMRKVIWNSGGDGSFESYNLSSDPREQRNLTSKGQKLDWASRMASSLRSYPVTAGRQARPGPKAELSPANRSRLESLGYAR
ncbi:MAG: sulfatase [Candidatus Binatia bacterium]